MLKYLVFYLINKFFLYINLNSRWFYKIKISIKNVQTTISTLYLVWNPCGIDFSITNSRWIIAAYTKSFVTDAFRKKYPNKYLQTDNCSLYIEEIDFKKFENDISRIDVKFPIKVELKDDTNYWKWILILFSTIIGILIILKRRKRTANKA